VPLNTKSAGGGDFFFIGIRGLSCIPMLKIMKEGVPKWKKRGYPNVFPE
jgi:hypothetical protein